MGYFLLDRPNPHGPHYYPSRARPLLAYVVHITAGLQDLDGVDDQSAEATARYAATTDRQVSWHVGSDTDSVIELLPPGYTAWHVSDYNSACYGHEFSKLHVRWGEMPPTWVDATLRQAARHAAAIAVRYGIPIRHATRAELDRAIATGGPPVGFIEHSVLDPTRRSDPGADFPWTRFLELVRHYATGGDDVSLSNEIIDVPIGTPGYQNGGKLIASLALGEVLHEVKVTQRRAERLEVQVAALGSDLRDDEADVIAAVRQIVAADQDADLTITDDQVATLAARIAAALPAGVTEAQMHEAVRQAFARAGAADDA